MNRIAALLLSVCLIVSIGVVPAFAAEEQTPTQTKEASETTKNVSTPSATDGDKKDAATTTPPTTDADKKDAEGKTPADDADKKDAEDKTPANDADKKDAEDKTPADNADKKDATTTPPATDADKKDAEDKTPADGAANTIFSDINGHWAQSTMLSAVKDGYIKGYEDQTLRPDASISTTEMMTILARALDASQATTSTDKATRGAAFVRLDESLKLSAGQTEQGLSQYKDAQQLTPAERRAVSALLSSGALTGFPDQTLRPQASISRAEFLTMLYRVLPQEMAAADVKQTPKQAVRLTGPTALANLTFTAPVYIDNSVKEASLTAVQADKLVFDSNLTKLTLSKGTKIKTLILPVAAVKTLSMEDDCRVDTLVIQGSSTSMTLSGNIGAVELGGSGNSLTVGGKITDVKVSGSGQSLVVNGMLDTLVFDGSATNVTFGTNSGVKELTFTSASAKHTMTLPGDLDTLNLDGKENLITMDGVVSKLLLRGTDNVLDGKGSVKEATLYSKKSSVLLPCSKFTNKTDEGIRDAKVTLSAPASLPVDSLLTITAQFSNTVARNCEAVWIVNDTEVKKETVSVTPTVGSTAYLARFTYKKEMNQDFKVRFELRYTTESGEKQVVSASGATWLENHPASYYDQYSVEKVLARVTTGYRGNRTTQWAIDNDYDQRTKEVWINAKGYSSPTQYLVWINTSMQHVNIFEGSQGNWKLIKSYLCGTGKPGMETPVGVYPIGTRTASGWTTSTYHVSPVLRFKQGSGLAFHSRQYDPRGRYIVDPTIGMPASQGCIRMYDEDIHWMYDNIPIYTTVVVF